MQLEAKDLRDAIAEGIQSLLGLSISLTDERNEDPQPEYLTTAAVAFSLGEFAKRRSLHGKLRIRCEAQTKEIWIQGRLKWFMKQVSALVKPTPKPDFRNGNVDITLYAGPGFERPFAVIENKKLLQFGQDGEVYKGDRDKMILDLKRNADFIVGLGAVEGVHYSAFTFYLRDKDSALMPKDSDVFKAAKKRYFEDLVDRLGLDGRLRRNVLIETWDHGLFPSNQAALEEDEYGQSAVEAEGAWHLLYGIISIYQPSSVVVDTQRLSDH